MILRDDDFQNLVQRILDQDLGNPRGVQGIDGVLDDVVRVLDDVDLLSPQFPDHRIDPAASHADAGTHRVHVVVPARHRHLGPFSRFPNRILDDDRVVVDFGNLGLEQTDQEAGIAPGDHDLGTLGEAVHLDDDRPHPIPHAVFLGAGLLVVREHGLGPADVQHDVAPFVAPHDSVDHLSDLARVLLEDVLPLRFPNFLENDLLGRLGGDTPQLQGRFGDLQVIPHFEAVVVLQGLGQSHLRLRLLDFLHDALDGKHFDGAGHRVVTRLQFLLGPEVLPGGGGHGVLKGFVNDLGFDAFFPAELFDALTEGIRHA